MKKGIVMPLASRKKMSKTKKARVQRRKIGTKVIQLLINDKTVQAIRLARKSADLFFLDKP